MITLSAPLGPQVIVTFVALTISNDIGGYAAGCCSASIRLRHR